MLQVFSRLRLAFPGYVSRLRRICEEFKLFGIGRSAAIYRLPAKAVLAYELSARGVLKGLALINLVP